MLIPSVSSSRFSAYYSTESLGSSDILGPKVLFFFIVRHQHVVVTTTSEGYEIILEQTCSVEAEQVLFKNIEFPYLLLPRTMQNYIHDMLTRLQIPPSNIEGLKQGISTYAYQRALNCKERRSRLMGIVEDLTVRFKEYGEEELEADILMDMDGDGRFSLLPASPASIQALEIKRYDLEDSSYSIESCMICMDELVRRVDIARLPCSHIFHSECIVKWLENKNSCPLCRFALPTQD